jgi:hypothetical protein
MSVETTEKRGAVRRSQSGQRNYPADHRMLGALLGRHNHFPLSIAVFTLASGLCGMAGSLGRAIQRLAGGGLQPSSKAVLQDPFPVEKQGMAMPLFGFAALTGHIVEARAMPAPPARAGGLVRA